MIETAVIDIAAVWLTLLLSVVDVMVDTAAAVDTAPVAYICVPHRDKVLLLNKATEEINYWQDEANKHSIEDARDKFPECVFLGN